MTAKLYHILFSATLLISAFSVSSLYAQDSPLLEPVENETEVSSGKESMLLSPGGEPEPRASHLKSSQTLAKDSLSSRVVPPLKIKAEIKQQKADDEDSILSFNFLYYILEKFKSSDIVDQ